MFFAIFLLGLLLSEVAVSPITPTSSRRVNKSGQINVVGLIVAILLLTLFFLQEVGVVLLVGHTARRDPKAWSTAFFEGLSYTLSHTLITFTFTQQNFPSHMFTTILIID